MIYKTTTLHRRVLLRNLMSRGNILSGKESALGLDSLCSNLESVTSGNISALCLRFLTYEIRVRLFPHYSY